MVVYSHSQGSSDATASAGVAEPCAGTPRADKRAVPGQTERHGSWLPSSYPTASLGPACCPPCWLAQLATKVVDQSSGLEGTGGLARPAGWALLCLPGCSPRFSAHS